MRVLMKFSLPLEPFNSLVKAGTAGATMEKVFGDIKPEAVYFTAENGRRGGIAVVDLADPSKMPALAEPLFLALNAEVQILPAMTPEDLANAGLDAIGAKYK